MIKFSLAVLANRMTSCDYIGLVHNMSCDWSLIGSFLEPIRINHVIQNIIMVIIFEYIIYIEFGYIEIIMSCHQDGGRSQGDTGHSMPLARRRGGFNFDV